MLHERDQGIHHVAVTEIPGFHIATQHCAKALKVARDGWAGFYFHWYLNPTELSKTIIGLKELGYQFVPLSGT